MPVRRRGKQTAGAVSGATVRCCAAHRRLDVPAWRSSHRHRVTTPPRPPQVQQCVVRAPGIGASLRATGQAGHLLVDIWTALNAVSQAQLGARPLSRVHPRNCATQGCVSGCVPPSTVDCRTSGCGGPAYGSQSGACLSAPQAADLASSVGRQDCPDRLQFDPSRGSPAVSTQQNRGANQRRSFATRARPRTAHSSRLATNDSCFSVGNHRFNPCWIIVRGRAATTPCTARRTNAAAAGSPPTLPALDRDEL